MKFWGSCCNICSFFSVTLTCTQVFIVSSSAVVIPVIAWCCLHLSSLSFVSGSIQCVRPWNSYVTRISNSCYRWVVASQNCTAFRSTLFSFNCLSRGHKGDCPLTIVMDDQIDCTLEGIAEDGDYRNRKNRETAYYLATDHFEFWFADSKQTASKVHFSIARPFQLCLPLMTVQRPPLLGHSLPHVGLMT